MTNAPVRLTEDIPYACKVLGISKNHGYELIKRGEFPVPVIKLGRRFVVSSASLRVLLMAPSDDHAEAPIAEFGGNDDQGHTNAT